MSCVCVLILFRPNTVFKRKLLSLEFAPLHRLLTILTGSEGLPVVVLRFNVVFYSAMLPEDIAKYDASYGCL